MLFSVNLDGSIDFVNEYETRCETNRSRHDRKGVTREKEVAEVDKRGQKINDLVSSRKVVVRAIQKEIDSCCSSTPQRAPPPVVILGAQVQIAQNHKDHSA